ncbi:MAG: ABC transporter ATP-binding protein [Tissierellia bacterium]|nr:ABC transporter ATP-binding protein [Tissierellia bacterium]
MLKFLENKFSLSKQGAKNMANSILLCAVKNLTNILPMMIIYNFLIDAFNIYIYKNTDSISIIKYIALILISFILMYLTESKQYDSVYTTTYNETANKRINLSKRIAKLPLSFFAGRDLSDLTKTIMSDMEAMEHAYSHAVPQFYGTLISTTIIAIMVAIRGPKMALAMFWPFPIAIILIYMLKHNKYKLEKEHADQTLVVSDKIQEILDNILPIRAFNRTQKSLSEFEQILDEEERIHFKAEKYNPIYLAPIYALFRIGIVTIILTGYSEFMKSNIDLPTMLTFIVITAILYVPMEGAMSFLIEFIYVSIPAERMKEVMQYEIMTGDDIEVDNYDIKVEDIHFGYDDEPVINGVSFRAKQGEVTALVGHSGCGKTTLVNLMLRFYDVDEGRILLGGKDIRDFDPDSLLKNFSMVFQDVLLFNNTIMENIRIGKKDASDEEVLEAAKIAQVDEFVKRLPNGYDTMVGEKGSLLSGGERQRISIARAILKDAPIIFLDESTASVDADSETKIQEALSHLIKDKTVVVIAHRLRTVINADKILVFDSGMLIEEGNSDELLMNKGYFYKMLEMQKQ